MEEKKRGRPSIFTRELGIEICRRISEGESLNQICKDEHMPSRSIVMDWLWDDDKKDFSDNYDNARLKQAQFVFDQLNDIADNGKNDWMERELQGGRIAILPDHEHISRSRLRVDTRKWWLSKIAPKVYGDKLDLTSGGEKIEGATVVLNTLERENEDLAKKAKEAYENQARQTSGGQMVANEQPVQNQGQTGQSGAVPSESNTAQAPNGASGQ